MINLDSHTIQLLPPDSLKPYEKNPRQNDKAVDAVAESISRYGFRQAIVVDKNMTIVVGHTRWKASKKLNLPLVPVHVALDMSEEDARSYRIADNKLNEIAIWDKELLPLELRDLKALDVDLAKLGFSKKDLEGLLGFGDANLDDIPQPPDAATTKRGDVWVLGDHRLMCGDSSLPADIDKLLAGQPIHLINTDPPYNVKVEPRSNNAIAAGLSSFPTTGGEGSTHHQGFDDARDPGKKRRTDKKLRPKDRPLANDFVSDGEFDRLLDAWFGNCARVMLPGASFYIWGGYANCANYPPFLKKHGLYFSQAIIWDKMHPVMTRKDFMGAHEWCFYGWREGAGHNFYGPPNAQDLWHLKKVNPQSMVHLTEKPAELAMRAMQYSSKEGENVLDIFGGSGSTLIGAQQTQRRAFLMELDELYCDVIVARWEKHTGKKAELEPCSKA